MKDLLSRIKYWIKKPASTNCRQFCVTCKWFNICRTETAPELQHQKAEHMPLHTEFRCCICESRHACPAYETGIIFPCTYFKEENHGTEE